MSKNKLVNLDAMIQRADFAVIDNNQMAQNKKLKELITLPDLEKESLFFPNLRKPDFQRETNHWAPEQIVSLIKCFCDEDLIPSVILWSSSTTIFVIDGGHRLSALRAWILDDYGDGALSQEYFGYNITDSQKRVAIETRKQIAEHVGSWSYWKGINQLKDAPEEKRSKAKSLASTGIQVQWVYGDADKAESSFYKINRQGTPLDNIETLLIRNRKKPGAIAARSIIRAGMGNKYWSGFPAEIKVQIEEKAKKIYEIIFEPEFTPPIKTLDLPLGGGIGIRNSLSLLIDLILLSNKNQLGEPSSMEQETEDENGTLTLRVLEKTLNLVKCMTGNENGSLGLHPVVYFYGPSGQHSIPLFMGIAGLIAKKLVNNDKEFFYKFTKSRVELEKILISNKRLLATIIQNTRSVKRHEMISNLFSYLIDSINSNKIPTEQDIVKNSGVTGKVITGFAESGNTKFNDDTKSAVYIRNALKNAMRCSICDGYLDTQKSVSYDHKIPVKSGGLGVEDNCQLTHPFCNQSFKDRML
jgi:hypothetical protein